MNYFFFFKKTIAELIKEIPIRIIADAEISASHPPSPIAIMIPPKRLICWVLLLKFYHKLQDLSTYIRINISENEFFAIIWAKITLQFVKISKKRSV